MPVVLHLRKDRHAKSTGFTLVEMMVVITISALLSALLLPSLSTAKEKSKRTVCKSNIRELLTAVEIYTEENADVLPSSADNSGLYHSIILSDTTFSNLLLLTGTSNIFYCPNIVFGDNPGTVAQHSTKYGYVIGYSYWGGYATVGSYKGPNYEMLPLKSTDPSLSTNALFSDANYWTSPANQANQAFPGGMAMAPHGALGAAMMSGSTFTIGVGTNSASIGAQGGNAGYFPGGSVVWRNINSMQKVTASSQDDAYGNR
jgi:prepilin-type N-terminal cleavage/methylation domain-containing protein